MRSVLIGPGPSRTFPDTFQLPAVSPAFCTGSLLEGDHSFVEGEITLESNQLITSTYGRGRHLGNEVGHRCIDGGIWEGERSYRSRNLIGTRAITCHSL